jgi:nitroreductase
MDLIEAIRRRKSIRKFKPDPVPRDVLREILGIASRAPSAMNTQPWEFVVMAGEVLERVRRANLEKLHAGQALQPEHPVIGWPQDSVYRRRQVELGMALFRLMDIPRNDPVKRMQWLERGFRYFDAPAAVILAADRMLGTGEPLLDLGAVMQTLCLAALDHGLGTCIEDQGVMYPDVIREQTGIPAQKRLIIAIAIGYPEEDFPANRIESLREPVDDVTTWCGFDGDEG